MEVVGTDGVISVAWFVVLVVIALVLAVVTKSLLANLGLVVVGILGLDIFQNLSGQSDVVRYGLIGVMICLMAFAVLQMVTRVEHI